MNKIQTAKKNTFLLELLITIGLFMILLIVGLRFFMKAHNMTKQTAELHEAVNICSNLASVYENGDGTTQPILVYYTKGIDVNSYLIIYFDENYQECTSDSAIYRVEVSPRISKDRLSSADIIFYDEKSEEIYQITAYHYTQQILGGKH